MSLTRAKSAPRQPVPDEALRELRDRILRRDRVTCQVCGAVAGEASIFHSGRTVSLTVGYITQKSKSVQNALGNMRAECTDCNEGLQNTPLPKVSRIELFKQIRRATIDDQRAALEWLLRKFQDRG